jgi:hypothetical protein
VWRAKLSTVTKRDYGEDLAQTSRPAFSTLRAITPFAPNPMDPMRAPHPIFCLHPCGPGQISRNGRLPAKLRRA